MARLPKSLKGKIAIITGANAGIGKITAKKFAKLEAKVFILCRDEEKTQAVIREICKELDSKLHSNIVFEQLDLSSLTSVQKCAAKINSKVSQIDYLINNAGVMACPEKRNVDGYELQFATNHLGPFLLTNLLIEKIKASKEAKIINLSSLAHVHGQIFFENINLKGIYKPLRAYSQSKLANILFTRELARRLQNYPHIKVFAVHPGVVATELSRHLSSFEQVNYKLLSINPELGAQTTLYCALDDRCQSDPSGGYYENCQLVENLWPHATDEKHAQKLWELSVKMCNTKNNNNKVEINDFLLEK